MAKILVVDDEADLKILIKQRFRQKIRKNEYDFVFAENGREALEQLSEHKDVDFVMGHLQKANFDPEFYTKYEREIYNSFKGQLTPA